jgi:hypothetical protein
VGARAHLFEPLPPRARRVVRWTIVLSAAVFLLVATSGRPWTLFDRGPFTSDFFEAQARALLHGRLDVPAATAGIEGFTVRGRTYLYYGIVPALPRIPFVLFTHALDGRLVVASRLVALAVALRAVAGIGWQARRLVAPARSERMDAVVVAGLVAVVGLSTPLLFLAARPVVYHEVELWGTALALVAFDRLLAWWRAPSAGGLALVGLAATLALSTRGSVGLGPVVALGLVLVDRLVRARRSDADGRDRRQLGGLALATAAPLVLYALVNLGRFGTVWSIPFSKQVLSSFGTDRQAALDFTHGSLFSLRYLPTAALQYLRPDAVGVQRLFPWFGFGPRADVIGSVRYDTVDRSSSITATAPLLCLVAIVGLVWLLRHRSGTRPWWFALAGTVVGVVVTWTIGFIAARYLADLVPTLVLAAAPGAWALAAWLGRRGRSARRLAVIGLAILGVWGLLVNTSQALLTEHLFLVVSPETRLDFIDLQHRIDSRLFGGSPYRVTIGPAAPDAARTGDLLISGECDGLYWYDGSSWTALERRPAGTRSLHASGPAPGSPATVANGTGWRIDAEVPSAGRLRFVYRSDTTVPVPGPVVSVAPGQALRLSLIADPVTTEVRLTADGVARPLVNAFLVPAAGPVAFVPPFVETEPAGPRPAVCGRLLDRAARNGRSPASSGR